MLRHWLHDVTMVWVVLFAVLCTKVSWPANTWRGVTLAICWLICLAMVLYRFVG